MSRREREPSIERLVVNFKGNRKPVEIVEPPRMPTRHELIRAKRPSLWGCLLNNEYSLRIVYPRFMNKPQEVYVEVNSFAGGKDGYHRWRTSFWNESTIYAYVNAGVMTFEGWLD